MGFNDNQYERLYACGSAHCPHCESALGPLSGPTVVGPDPLVVGHSRLDPGPPPAQVSPWAAVLPREGAGVPVQELQIQRPTPETSSLVAEIPPPTPNGHPAVWDLVVADMRERDREGRRKYGTPLQPLNGRPMLVDAYQEALDLAVYLRAEIEERRLAPKPSFATFLSWEETRYGKFCTATISHVTGVLNASGTARTEQKAVAFALRALANKLLGAGAE